MKKYIIVLIISFFACGIICAASNDTLSLKILMSTDPFYKKSTLVIQNNHLSPVIIRLQFRYSMVDEKVKHRSISGDELDTYFYWRGLNLASNQESGKVSPLTLRKGMEASFGQLKWIKPDSIFKIPIDLVYADIDNSKYKMSDLYVKLVYITEDEMIATNGKGFHIKEFRNIEFDIHHPTTPCCTPAPIPPSFRICNSRPSEFVIRKL